jgi:hypothetical protein
VKLLAYRIFDPVKAEATPEGKAKTSQTLCAAANSAIGQ